MKTIFINDLKKNQIFENETFAIFECDALKDKNDSTYYNLTIGDKTGKLSAKIWSDKASVIPKSILKKDSVVQVSGKVDEYKGALQINILSINQIDSSALDEFIESSEFDANEMFNDLMLEVNKLKHIGLKTLVTKVFNDKEIERRFKYWPAAVSVHHDFRSGLLQHVSEMVAISKSLIRFYPNVNYELLLVAIILHDIGKIYELDAGGIAATYSTEGQLLGHISIAFKLIDKFDAKELLKEDLYLHLMHLILSHHGQLDFGSPVLPSTVEAVMLTNIDNLSAKSRIALKTRDNISKDFSFSSSIMWLNGARIWKGEVKENLVNDDSNKTQKDEAPSSLQQLSL